MFVNVRKPISANPTNWAVESVSVPPLVWDPHTTHVQAVIAGFAGILLVAAVAVQIGGPHAKVDEQTLGLITENKRITRDVIGAGLDAIGYLALVST